MPYRINGNCVQKQTGDTWENVEGGCHKTPALARAHLTALNMNVQHGKSMAAVQAFKSALAVTQTLMPDAPFSDSEKDDFERTFRNVYQETGDETKARLAAYGALKRRKFGLAVKSAQAETIVSGWAIWFSDTQYRDRQNTHFPRKTALMLEYYPNAPLWYEHGADPDYGWEVIGKRVAYEVYDHGVWMSHALDANHRFYGRTMRELNRGILAYSSDSVGHFVEQGYIPNTRTLSVWPMVGCSLTSNEAEPGLGQVILDSQDNI